MIGRRARPFRQLGACGPFVRPRPIVHTVDRACGQAVTGCAFGFTVRPADAGPVQTQLTFEDVVECELIAGDRDYTAWLTAGRPQLDRPTAADTPGAELDAPGASVQP